MCFIASFENTCYPCNRNKVAGGIIKKRIRLINLCWIICILIYRLFSSIIKAFKSHLNDIVTQVRYSGNRIIMSSVIGFLILVWDNNSANMWFVFEILKVNIEQISHPYPDSSLYNKQIYMINNKMLTAIIFLLYLIENNITWITA